MAPDSSGSMGVFWLPAEICLGDVVLAHATPPGLPPFRGFLCRKSGRSQSGRRAPSPRYPPPPSPKGGGNVLEWRRFSALSRRFRNDLPSPPGRGRGRGRRGAARIVAKRARSGAFSAKGAPAAQPGNRQPPVFRQSPKPGRGKAGQKHKDYYPFAALFASTIGRTLRTAVSRKPGTRKALPPAAAPQPARSGDFLRYMERSVQFRERSTSCFLSICRIRILNDRA